MIPPETNGTQHPMGDQLAATAHFLDELELKTPVKHLQRETDGNKALLDTINSLIAVVRVARIRAHCPGPTRPPVTNHSNAPWHHQGAFIAGVQAQIIGLTNDSNGTALGRATNWFAFVGLALDLIGTSSGVARALLLQAAMRRTHRLATRLTGQIDGVRHQLRQLQLRGTGLAADAHARAFLADSVRAISDAMALLAEDGRFGVQAAERIIEIEVAGELALGALGSLPRARARPWWRFNWGKQAPHLFRALMLWNVDLSNVHVEGLGHIPVASLGGGALCLLTSVVLFAARSQERAVWISCTAIAVSMLICSIMPTTSVHSESISVLIDACC